MAILVYTGKPRSGKTYLCVHQILTAAIQKKYVILHNIRGLRDDLFESPEHVRDWSELIGPGRRYAKYEEFFNLDVQQKLCEETYAATGKNVLIIVDEAHVYGFDRVRVAMRTWLAQHGQLGQEVWLIAQRETMIHRDYVGMGEFVTHAMCDHMFRLPWVFLYRRYSQGQSSGMFHIRKDQAVYDAYQSYVIAGARGHASKLVPILVVLVLGAGWWWFHNLRDMGKTGKESQKMEVVGKRGEAVAAVPPASVRLPERKLFAGYRYAGERGLVVMLQKKDGGGLTTVEDVAGVDCRVVERASGCVRMLCDGMPELQRVCKSGKIKVQEKEQEGVSSRGSL